MTIFVRCEKTHCNHSWSLIIILQSPLTSYGEIGLHMLSLFMGPASRIRHFNQKRRHEPHSDETGEPSLRKCSTSWGYSRSSFKHLELNKRHVMVNGLEMIGIFVQRSRSVIRFSEILPKNNCCRYRFSKSTRDKKLRIKWKAPIVLKAEHQNVVKYLWQLQSPFPSWTENVLLDVSALYPMQSGLYFMSKARPFMI